MKISLCKTYDGIEAYLKSNNTLIAQRLGVEQLPEHSVIARGMLKMPTSYIQLISKLVTSQMRRRGMDVTVDSSGFCLKTSSKWFDIKDDLAFHDNGLEGLCCKGIQTADPRFTPHSQDCRR